jgi:hypothetical protein
MRALLFQDRFAGAVAAGLKKQTIRIHARCKPGGGTPYRECTGSALALAKQFHDTYERLAPTFGYETRPETREFNPESPNGRLMIAVCKEIIEQNAESEASDETV